MIVTTEQSTAKLKLLPKPIDDLSDDELQQFLDSVIRPARSKITTKKPRGAAKAAKTKSTGGLDDLDSIAD